MSAINDQLPAMWKDDQVKNYFLMSSPLIPISILSSYFALVLVLIPKYMENRKPVNLKVILGVYNIIQVAINSTLVILSLTYFEKFCVFCPVLAPESTQHDAILLNAKIFYLYMLSKIFDLSDTIILALRKYNSKISPLHLHHHSTMLVGTWYYLYSDPRIMIVYLSFMNSLVHVIMYLYYFLTNWDSNMRYVRFIKKIVTQIQILQHFSILVFYIALYSSGYLYASIFKLVFFFVNLMIVIGFFIEFYVKTYLKRNKAAKH